MDLICSADEPAEVFSICALVAEMEPAVVPVNEAVELWLAEIYFEALAVGDWLEIADQHEMDRMDLNAAVGHVAVAGDDLIEYGHTAVGYAVAAADLVEYIAVEHAVADLVEHIAVEHIAVEHIAVEHIAVEHIAVEHIAVVADDWVEP